MGTLGADVTRITLQLGSERQSFELSPARVRGHDVPAHGPHPAADRGGSGRGRLDWHSLDGVLAGGRFDPDADGPLVRHARWPASRRGRGERR